MGIWNISDAVTGTYDRKGDGEGRMISRMLHVRVWSEIVSYLG